MNLNIIPLIFSLICMSGWGVENFLIAKFSRKINPLQSAFVVQFYALILTAFFIPVFYKSPSSSFIIFPIFFGIVTGISLMAFCKSLRDGNVSIVMPIISSWFLITSLLGIIVFKEKIDPTKIISLILVFIGVIFLSFNWQSFKKNTKNILSAGVPGALLVALLWGIQNFGLGYFGRLTNWYFSVITTRFFSVIFLFLIIKFLRQKIVIDLRKLPWKILLVIVFLDFISYTFYNLAVSKFDVSFVSVIASSSPIVSVALAVYFFREKTNFIQKMGFIAVLSGIILLQLK